MDIFNTGVKVTLGQKSIIRVMTERKCQYFVVSFYLTKTETAKKIIHIQIITTITMFTRFYHFNKKGCKDIGTHFFNTHRYIACRVATGDPRGPAWYGDRGCEPRVTSVWPKGRVARTMKQANTLQLQVRINGSPRLQLRKLAAICIKVEG